MIVWLEPAPASPIRWLDAPSGALAGLPSADSAEQLVGGDLTALPVAAFHTVARAGLVAIGLYGAGMRGAGQLFKYSIAGALGIEAFVLLWALYEKGKAKT